MAAENYMHTKKNKLTVFKAKKPLQFLTERTVIC